MTPPRSISRRAFATGALFTGLVATALLPSGCARPEPPTVRPLDAQVTSLDAQGLGLRVRFEATNPNRIALVAQRVTGHVTLAGGTIDLGTLAVDHPVTLPARATTVVEVPMAVHWTNLGALGALAAQTESVPFVVDGSVTVGGERLHVDVPFTLNGTLRRDDLVRATLRSLPAIPGLLPPP